MNLQINFKIFSLNCLNIIHFKKIKYLTNSITLKTTKLCVQKLFCMIYRTHLIQFIYVSKLNSGHLTDSNGRL